MSQNGLERRGRGLLATLRRSVYGLMLWIGAGSESLAEDGQRPPLKVDLSIELLRGQPGEMIDVYRVGVAADDPRLGRTLNGVARLLRLRQHETVERVRNIRHGMGIDIELPDAGKLHLMLHPRKDDLERGARWNLADPEPESGGELWSLGAAVDVIHVQRYDWSAQAYERERRVEVVPQLIVDADRLLGLRGKAVMTLQQACWKSSAGMRDEAVVQLRLKWSF